jgi:hypothetical protein
VVARGFLAAIATVAHERIRRDVVVTFFLMFMATRCFAVALMIMLARVS